LHLQSSCPCSWRSGAWMRSNSRTATAKTKCQARMAYRPGTTTAPDPRPPVRRSHQPTVWCIRTRSRRADTRRAAQLARWVGLPGRPGREVPAEPVQPAGHVGSLCRSHRHPAGTADQHQPGQGHRDGHQPEVGEGGCGYRRRCPGGEQRAADDEPPAADPVGAASEPASLSGLARKFVGGQVQAVGSLR
jgi:hypothetical protein